MKVDRVVTKSNFTRYFLFTRVKPYDHDYSLLVSNCARINSFLGYRTVVDDAGVKRLVGFIILRGPRTFVQGLFSHFPNFMLTPLKSDGDLFFFDYSDFPGDMIYYGEHPYLDIRKSLF